jgi:dihydropteroate synthase
MPQELCRVKLVGILNVTPDSFSDGGCDRSSGEAIARGLALFEAGADWVDVGGESTRPGSVGVSLAEELSRVIPVVAGLVERGVAVSIDTSKVEVARRALEAGAEVVNDVRALQAPGMVEAVAEAGAGAVLMHMRGKPDTMQESTRYEDVVGEVAHFLEQRLAVVRHAGIAPVWVDPGIGFGKTTEQNLALLRGLPRLAALGAPIYVGASRKRFIGDITNVAQPAARLGGSLGAAAAAVVGGAAVIRVHDVAETRRMLDVYLACVGRTGETLT